MMGNRRDAHRQLYRAVPQPDGFSQDKETLHHLPPPWAGLACTHTSVGSIPTETGGEGTKRLGERHHAPASPEPIAPRAGQPVRCWEPGRGALA